MKFVLCALLLLSTTALAVRGPLPKAGFRSCAQANAAGWYGMRRGQPGYAPKLDRDHDGIACELKKTK